MRHKILIKKYNDSLYLSIERSPINLKNIDTNVRTKDEAAYIEGYGLSYRDTRMALAYLHYSKSNIFERIGLKHAEGIQKRLKAQSPSLQKNDCLFIYAYSTSPPDSRAEHRYRQGRSDGLPFDLHTIDLTGGGDIQLAANQVISLIARNLSNRM